MEELNPEFGCRGCEHAFTKQTPTLILPSEMHLKVDSFANPVAHLKGSKNGHWAAACKKREE